MWTGTVTHKTPNLDEVFRSASALDVDGVVMWWFKSLAQRDHWPVELYFLDLDNRRVYHEKGDNKTVGRILDRILSDARNDRAPRPADRLAQ